jgi:hypothetical protein
MTMKTYCNFLIVACLACGVSSSFAASTPVERKNVQPTSQPTTMVSIPVLRPPAQPITVTDAYPPLKLTKRDEQILQKISDGGQSIEENSFYLLMSRVAGLGKLNKEQIKKDLDAVTWRNLTRTPNRYRFQPVRMKVKIFYIGTLTVDSRKISATPYWPSEKPIYAIHCTNADAVDHASEPMILYSASLPPDLPEKSHVEDDGSAAYRSGPEYDIAGVFYKYTINIDKKSSQPRKYPVILVWQMSKAESPVAVSWSQRILAGAGFLVAVLIVVVFLFIKKRVTRRPARPMFGDYKPLRDEEEDYRPGEEDQPTEVDPDLTAAVKEYRKDHSLHDNEKGAHHDGTNRSP